MTAFASALSDLFHNTTFRVLAGLAALGFAPVYVLSLLSASL